MRTITITQGDSKPDLIIVLFDKQQSLSAKYGVGLNVTLNNSVDDPSTAPEVAGALDLSDAKVSVLARFRSIGATGNQFSVYCSKIDSGSTGGVLMKWPIFGTEVDAGDYEIEITVFWGIRSQTSVDTIPVYIQEQFNYGGKIADDEDVRFVDGKLYLRNWDTNNINALIALGSDEDRYIYVSDGEALPDHSVDPETVTVKIVSGALYLYNDDEEKWQQLSLHDDSGIPYFELGEKELQLDSSTSESIQIATCAGKFYVKNLDTGKWHNVRIRGIDGTQSIEVGDGETL